MMIVKQILYILYRAVKQHNCLFRVKFYPNVIRRRVIDFKSSARVNKYLKIVN